jgi:CheY-like chemotaxis protein
MKTILFVDDDDAFRRLAKVIFEEEGYRVVTAGDGREALETVTSARPDVAILDIRMPKTSGFDVAEELGQLTPEVPIIFYTGNDETCLSDERSRLGAACIEKSGDFTELALAVRRVLSPARRREGCRVGLPPQPR